jgi:hypothetical protein
MRLSGGRCSSNVKRAGPASGPACEPELFHSRSFFSVSVHKGDISRVGAGLKVSRINVWGLVMRGAHRDVFELAFAGIPRVAEVIAALRLEDRPRALHAVEQRYRQMARESGVSEGAADVWGAAVMSLLRLCVREDEYQRSRVSSPAGP